MNFLTGFVLILILFSQATGFVLPTIDGFLEGYGVEDSGLQPGDVVYSLDGHRIYNYNNLTFFLGRAGDTLDFVVLREGEKVRLDGVEMPLQARTDEEGKTTYLRGISVGREIIPATLGSKLLYSWYNSLDFVRTVWISLGDLVSGVVGLRDLSGPVGIVTTISQVGTQSETVGDAVYNILYLSALIAVNLAVMNLLPLPALDGGRIFFLFLNGLLFGLFRRKIDPKYEGYVHMAGLALLLILIPGCDFQRRGQAVRRLAGPDMGKEAVSMTRQIHVGGIPIGGGAPVTIQSMTNTRTDDVESTLSQIRSLAAAGCQIVRVAVP